MRLEKIENANITTHIRHFDNMNEFYNYITTTPTNDIFSTRVLQSKKPDKGFSGTSSFSEAVDLFKHGWDVMAKRLNKDLKEITGSMQVSNKRRAQFDVVGFQASVPRYLQGIPTNMVNQKIVQQKQKVVTFTKDISYSAKFDTEQIIDESVKALQIIKTIEAQGVRCNLNIIHGSGVKAGGNVNAMENILKIRIKNANERLNISKLAFPLVHPSMLRRLIFRYIETSPTFSNRNYTWGYGRPTSESILKKMCEKNGEYFLEREIANIDKLIAKFIK